MSSGIHNPLLNNFKEMLTLSSPAPQGPQGPGGSTLRDQTAATEMVSVGFQPKPCTYEHGSPATQHQPKTAYQHGAEQELKRVEPMVIPDQYLTDAAVAEIYAKFVYDQETLPQAIAFERVISKVMAVYHIALHKSVEREEDTKRELAQAVFQTQLAEDRLDRDKVPSGLPFDLDPEDEADLGYGFD